MALYEKIYRDRFSFGKNWEGYVEKIDNGRIKNAEKSLVNFLGKTKLKGKTFIDVGCGSGLFSLAAYRLGAKKVVSVDVDQSSVMCCKTLRSWERNPPNWKVLRGSILDEKFLRPLGKYDVVYSWGVLHHTGRMWKAVEHASRLVKKGGLLYIAIYNEKVGFQNSAFWLRIKRFYGVSNFFVKKLIEILYILQVFFYRIVKLQNPFSYISRYESVRGMDFFTDVTDWLGGYPYEYAKFDVVKDFVENMGFELINSKDIGNSIACNEFLFRKL